MILKQYYLGCLAHASYLIVDSTTKTAIVVDPQRDIDQYLEDAEAHGASIRYVFLTHFHADFLAGHLELAKKTGAEIRLGAAASAAYDFTPMGDGDTLELGDVRIVTWETPGHTPESISILVYDRAQSEDTPHAVLTGDTLFIGDVGRPDLMASIGITAEDLAGQLYDSLHQKLMTLPDETLVYPAHGAGSMCGKNLSTDTVSTIGDQRRLNYALQPMTKDEFVRMSTTGLPQQPAYFAYDAELNRSTRQTLDEALAASEKELDLDELLRLQSEGAQLLDTRNASDFAEAHLEGAVNVGLDGNYATWSGTLLDKDAPILLITNSGEEHQSVMRLGRIGFDRVAGYLSGGMQAARSKPELLRGSKRVEPSELRSRLDGEAPPLVVDVRGPGEWETSHIDGALHVPLPRLQAEIDRVPRDRELVLVCKSGYRSSSAASVLSRLGYDEVSDLAGGMDAWEGKDAAVEGCGS